MGYIGTKPSAVPLTSADITDGIITNADIANSTINLTTKVTGSLPFANGGTGLTALGSANQVLAVNSGGTALAYTAVSSDYVLLATTDITSSTASASFDGYFSSTYKNYKVIISNLIPVTSNTYLYGRLRRSNADVTTANYSGSGFYNKTCTASENSYADLASQNDTKIVYTIYGLYTTSSYQTVNEVTIYDPLGTSNRKKINFTSGYYSNACGHEGIYNHSGSIILQDNTNALSGLTFYFSSGNIATGNFKLYGIK